MALDIERYRRKLIEERDQIGRELGNIKDSTVPPTDHPEITAANAHVISEMVDVEATVKDIKTHRLDKINAALQAIDDGTYGICIVCGKQIDPRRLDAEPAALTCTEHLPKKEADFAAPTL